MEGFLGEVYSKGRVCFKMENGGMKRGNANRVISNRGALYNPANHPLSGTGKPVKIFDRSKLHQTFSENRAEQERNGVNTSIHLHHFAKQVRRSGMQHCFKCRMDKNCLAFMAAGSTWCDDCANQD